MLNLIYTTVVTIVMMVMVVTSQLQPDNSTCFQGTEKKITECCKMPPIGEHDVISRCLPKHKPKVAPAHGTNKTEGSCIAQCMLKTAKAFKNYTIDKEAVNSTLQSMFVSDGNFTPLLDEIVEQCHKSVSSNATLLAATPVSAHSDRPACSFLPEAFVNCVGSALMQKCPATAWTDSDDCNQLKQKLASGCSLPFL